MAHLKKLNYGQYKKTIYLHPDGLIYDALRFNEEINTSSTELYYSKFGLMWKNPGELAARIESDGNGYNVELTELKCRLNYGDAYDLFLLLSEEFSEQKYPKIRFKAKKIPGGKKKK